MGGMLEVTAESCNVRHVGNAMVVFDPRRVAPLYVVTHKAQRWNAPAGYSYMYPYQASAQRWWEKNNELREDRARRKAQKQHQRSCRRVHVAPSHGAVAFLSRRAAQKYRQ